MTKAEAEGGAFRAEYSFGPGKAARAGLGAGCAALFAAGALLGLGPLALAAWCASCACALAWCACDVRARTIPLETTGAFLACAALYRLAWGAESLGWGLVAGAVCAAALLGTSKLYAAMGKPHAVGGGDVRLVFPVGVACGADGLAWGILAMAAAFAVWALALKAHGRLSMSATIPMGPLLAVWALAGMAASAL